MAFIPGAVCLVMGYCTRQAIGYGDAILLCSLGMLYSLQEILFICMTAVTLAGIVGLVLLVVFRKSGKYEIPFVPFLLAGWMVLFIEGH